MSSEIYTRDFFDDVERTARSSALRVVPAVIRAWRPRHVVDVGCGEGVWAATFEALGVPALGIDGEYVQPSRVLVPHFVAWPLDHPLPHLGRFDLCLCLEVAEHLPPEAADTLVASVAGLADRVLFSAALPGQGGTGHVNEQPHEYWIERFDRLGFASSVDWPSRFADDGEVAWWYRQNMIVFERRHPRPADPPRLPHVWTRHSEASDGGRWDVDRLAAHLGTARELAEVSFLGPTRLRALKLAVRRLVRPFLSRQEGCNRELVAALALVDGQLSEIREQLRQLLAVVGDDEGEGSVAVRLRALEYAVRRLHGPLLVEGEG